MESMVEIQEHIYSTDRHFCVLGVMNNESGLLIRDQMMKWLSKFYNIIEVIHDGSQFEFPALSFMQKWCKETGNPCLYLHTRGAVNQYWTTPKTHKLWEIEFGQCGHKYFDMVNNEKPMCVCPFTSGEKHTFYNGFVVNAKAMEVLDTITPNDDRFVFEDIFKGSIVEVVGTKTKDCIESARLYLKKL